jgi:hypothetical protein
MVRAAPSTSARVLGTCAYGELCAVEGLETHSGEQWARLAPAERHSLVSNLSAEVKPPFAPPAAYVLLDGRRLGLGQLLQPAPTVHRPPRRVWELPHRLYAACHPHCTWDPVDPRSATWQPVGPRGTPYGHVAAGGTPPAADARMSLAELYAGTWRHVLHVTSASAVSGCLSAYGAAPPAPSHTTPPCPIIPSLISHLSSLISHPISHLSSLVSSQLTPLHPIPHHPCPAGMRASLPQPPLRKRRRPSPQPR